MKAGGYVPDRGEVVWLEFDPRTGHEQAGRRPAMVLSPALYNARSSLAIVCPITRQQKGYPFETPIPEALPIGGVVLADHARSVDWKARRAERICRIPDEVIAEVTAKLVALISSPEPD
ncbi:MAG TPA: endoribonuclease MazF [Verrucomicrobiae bacterium]|nr:endoribonuclease MazF [Verrucomicrobiae bacterium]